ncbi:GNAT family N-acetyltransferase [Rhodoligotrophos defluvii]|uniref:GNAT family N-acetyltransferase n=1 Tax=Rhodoligotrophos defluvii TaxID=2561934 RepID=UPI0010C98AC5|nr:GNAT family N-acetyltransferase [Rhodoligotrophos defluvii]
MGDPAERVISVESAIADIAPAQWDACANPPGRPYNPFVSHAFLKALEASGSVGAEAGWLPRHLVLRGSDGEIAGCMPCYLKSHSQGEYVFDHGWADAYERAGGRYYPKLQVSVPFTPATGPRLLVPDVPDAEARRQALVAGAMELVRRGRLSSAHFTFLSEQDRSTLAGLGLLMRSDQQFHWLNEGYRTFDDFLAALQSRKRKTLRKERQQAVAPGVTIEWVTGRDLTEAHWDAFFAFYMDTGSRKWGRPYLNRRFFSLVSEAMANDILLVMCKRAGRYIAGALNFIGSDTLYGRYWGAIEHLPFLHFETCYYQAIAFAIDRGLARVEAGAQGEHKLARGYLPHTTWSAHYIADRAFARAVADYLERERRHVDEMSHVLCEFSPFRQGT